MTAKWLPVESGIVPLGDPSSGPAQEEECFAELQGALEDARGEYRLRRYDAAEARLGLIISATGNLRDGRSNLLAAAAYSLQGRIHWRRAERALETRDDDVVRDERSKQDAAFRNAIDLFRANERFISADLPESRLCTDYAIALFRTGEREDAIERLERAQATGVMAADSFAYLGMGYRERGDGERALDALQKGLQLAPGDKVLLENVAVTLQDAGSREAALRTYCKAAVAAGKDEDLATAQKLLKAALKIKPDDAQALSMLTLLLHSQNDDTAAKELLCATLEKFPTNPWALGLRGMILRDQGAIQEALVDFGRARVDSPDLAWVALEHAKAVASSDPPKARRLVKQACAFLGENDVRVLQARVEIQARGAVQVKLLRKINSRRPDLVQPREELAARLVRQGKYAEAIIEAEGALALAPDSASLLGLKARALDGNGDLIEAVRFYRRASRAAREDDDRFGELLLALVRANRREEALHEVERRLALFKDNGRALAAKGRLLYDAGRFEEAVEPLQAAEPLVTDDRRLIVGIQLAESLRELDRYGEALQALERAAHVDNALGDAHAYKATFLADIAEYEQAAALLEGVIGRVPADASDEETKRRLGWLWSNRAVVLRRAGRTPLDQLAPMFEKASTLDPDNLFAKRNVAWTLMQQPDGKEKGERLIRELMDRHAELPNQLRAWCHFILKQYEGAEHWLRSILSEDPTDIGTRFDLALVLLAIGQNADAKVEYTAASELARKKSVERQRGLFDVALSDLIDAYKEGRVDSAQAHPVWRCLWKELKAAGLRRDKLDRLKYPPAKESVA